MRSAHSPTRSAVTSARRERLRPRAGGPRPRLGHVVQQSGAAEPPARPGCGGYDRHEQEAGRAAAGRPPPRQLQRLVNSESVSCHDTGLTNPVPDGRPGGRDHPGCGRGGNQARPPRAAPARAQPRLRRRWAARRRRLREGAARRARPERLRPRAAPLVPQQEDRFRGSATCWRAATCTGLPRRPDQPRRLQRGIVHRRLRRFVPGEPADRAVPAVLGRARRAARDVLHEPLHVLFTWQPHPSHLGSPTRLLQAFGRRLAGETPPFTCKDKAG